MNGDIEYVDLSDEADIAARADEYCVTVTDLLRVIEIVGPELTPIGAYLYGETLDESLGVDTPARMKAWPQVTADIGKAWRGRRRAPPTYTIRPGEPTTSS